MIVELLACTQYFGGRSAAHRRMNAAGWVDHPEVPQGVSSIPISAGDELSEFAGRLCYQSWDRPNEATRTNQGYLANIIAQRHFSVLEHASATFYVAGVSRSFSHELVRHRHLSFSQVSQRYVNEAHFNFIEPPAVAHAQIHADETRRVPLGQLATDIAAAYQQLVENLIYMGLTRKEARQAARCVLPNATETKLVVTGNMRAWRDVIEKRISPAADAEMQVFARNVLERLLVVAPSTFQDMREMITLRSIQEPTKWDYETEGFGGT